MASNDVTRSGGQHNDQNNNNDMNPSMHSAESHERNGTEPVSSEMSNANRISSPSGISTPTHSAVVCQNAGRWSGTGLNVLPSPVTEQSLLRAAAAPISARASSHSQIACNVASSSFSRQSELRKQSTTYPVQSVPGVSAAPLAPDRLAGMSATDLRNHLRAAPMPNPGGSSSVLHSPRRSGPHVPPALSRSSASDHNMVGDLSPRTGWSVVDTASSTAGGNPPCQRSLHTAAVLNGSLLVFGGYDGQARVNDFYAFSFSEKRWSPVMASSSSGRPPSPRDRHVSVVHGNTFYVFGGFDGTMRVNDFFGFDFSSMTWRRIHHTNGTPPSARHSHSAVTYDDSIYIFAGYDGSYRSDFHCFSVDTNEWSIVQAAGRTPRARYRATCVVHKNSMVLFGGHDGTRHLSDTHIFDFETGVWTVVMAEGTHPIPRDSHVSVVHADSMYVFGGSTGSAMNDLHELQLPTADSPSARWKQITSLGTIGHRFCHVGAVYADAMYIFGGYDGSNRLNDFVSFKFAEDDLTCDVPPSNLVSDLRSFLNDEALTDITFIVDGQPVYAHKIMLMRCSYFRAMLLGNMMEANQSTIYVEEVSHSVFMLLLEYLYTDELIIPADSAMDLFVAADLFDVPRLQAMCERSMLESITIESAASIFHAADVHSAKSLRSKTLKYILSHFELISKTPAFEEMARSNVELVFEILRSR